MKVIDDLISDLAKDSAVQDSMVGEVYCCVNWTAVFTRNWGLASSLREGDPYHSRIRGVGKMRGKPALELAEYANSDKPMEATIGMATINSLIDIDETRCTTENAFGILAEKGRGKNIVVVGHFPFIPKLKEIAGRLWVIEKKPRGEDLPAEAAEDVLPRADVVGLTGTTLINHTFPELMKLCRGSFVVMIGPSSPLSPVLFDYGIDVISGIKVIQPERMLACITEGAMFKQIEGLKYLSMKK